MCPDAIALAIYDQLYPFTREDIAYSDHIWDLFHADIPGTFCFPRPADFYAHPQVKIGWVRFHEQQLRPLIDWWETAVSKTLVS